MLHLIKYQFRQTVREHVTMFWALAFPIILGTLFYISFGNSDMGEDMDVIAVAVVEENTSGSAQAFLAYLDALDGDIVALEPMSKDDALDALKADEVEGIFVRLDGVVPLPALLDTYRKNTEIALAVGEKHPEGLADAMGELEDWRETTEEVSVGGRTLNPNISYFFALIAYACLSGAFLGVKGCLTSRRICQRWGQGIALRRLIK